MSSILYLYLSVFFIVLAVNCVSEIRRKRLARIDELRRNPGESCIVTCLLLIEEKQCKDF